MKRALCTGGDVDTFAAIAGNLAGAHNGVEKLPEHLMNGLLERKRIVELCRNLFQDCVGSRVREV